MRLSVSLGGTFAAREAEWYLRLRICVFRRSVTLYTEENSTLPHGTRTPGLRLRTYTPPGAGP